MKKQKAWSDYDMDKAIENPVELKFDFKKPYIMQMIEKQKNKEKENEDGKNTDNR